MNDKDYRNLFNEIGWEEQRNERIISLIGSYINMLKTMKNYDKQVLDAIRLSLIKVIKDIWDEWEAGNVSNGE